MKRQAPEQVPFSLEAFCCLWSRYCQQFSRCGFHVSAGNRNSAASILWNSLSKSLLVNHNSVILQLCSQPSMVEHSKHMQRERLSGYSRELWAGASLVTACKETHSAAWGTVNVGNRAQEKPSFLFSVLAHGEIVHSSAVQAPCPCLVTIYVCAENKEAAEFFFPVKHIVQ